MIKYFCDKCNKEIDRNNQWSAYWNGKRITNLCQTCYQKYESDKVRTYKEVKEIEDSLLSKWRVK